MHTFIKLFGYSEHMRAAAIILDRNRILLMHRIKEGKEYYVLPGGTIEKGESPEETVIREIKEETNLDAKIERKLGSVTQEEDSLIKALLKFRGNMFAFAEIDQPV